MSQSHTPQQPNSNAGGPRRRLLAPCLALVAMTLTAAGYEGWLENRWAEPVDRQLAQRRLANVPERIADWELDSSEPLEPSVVKMLRCSGYLNRIYRHRVTDERVQVAVLAGPSGPISVHTPEICYSSRDYQTVDAPRRMQVRPNDRPDEALWETTFRENGSEGGLLRVAYGWSAGDFWKAPSQPRFTFGGEPLLYKLQLAVYQPPGAELEATDACRIFLRDFLPVLDAALWAAPATTP